MLPPAAHAICTSSSKPAIGSPFRRRATIFPCRRPGATCCLPAVSASRLCWRWLKRLPPERGAGAALLCRQFAPDRLLPRLNQLTANGTVAIHCSEEGASLRQRVPECLTVPHPDTAVIACGPEGFIQRLRSVMEEYRWSPSQFVFERFTPAAENNTAAKNAFYIELASSGQRLQVAADQTIAQVLQHAGVEVMLSCEQGMCGSCITGVLDGIPEHRDSVLTAEEKAGNDQITLCCSRAKSPGLVLDL